MFEGMHSGWYKGMGDQRLARYHVRNYLWIFVNAQIENPSFDSQTKETLTLKAAKFGPDGPVLMSFDDIWCLNQTKTSPSQQNDRSSCQIPDKMIEKVLKTGIAGDSTDQY